MRNRVDVGREGDAFRSVRDCETGVTGRRQRRPELNSSPVTRDDLEAALRRQDEIDLTMLERGERVGRAHPCRIHELVVVMCAVVALGGTGDEEPGVVATGGAEWRQPM